VAQAIEVGQDQNKKTISSLVLVPGEAPETEVERGKWPYALQTFHTALKEALKAHGTPFQYETGVLPATAVDLEAVRQGFYRHYADGEEDKEKSQAAMQKAFTRGLAEASRRKIIQTLRDAKGRVMVWLTRG
jgi:hypothetical protein